MQSGVCATLSCRSAKTCCRCKGVMAATPLLALSPATAYSAGSCTVLSCPVYKLTSCHCRWEMAAIPLPMPSAWRRFVLSSSGGVSSATLAPQQHSRAPAAALVAPACSQRDQHRCPFLGAHPAQGQAPPVLPSRRAEVRCLGSPVRGPVPLARLRVAACLAAAPLGQHPPL